MTAMPPPSSPRPRPRRSPRGPGPSRRAHPGGARPAGRRPARRGARGLLRHPLAIVLVAFLVTILIGLLILRLGGGGAAQSTTGTHTEPDPVVPDPSGFTAATLIDDEVFYNSQAMTLAEVRDFVSRVNDGCMPGLDGTPCLAQAVFDVEAHEATAYCAKELEQAAGISAAEVIWAVSQACGINPQVLLVLIHKEQGLLTASGEALTARDYEAAAGYACPDGTECDPQWAGFPNQLYGAASQFQRYRQEPGEYDVVAQVPTRVAYAPQAQCGGSELTVTNQATAGLYNYTPFQPNEAAAEGGDACTAWGNWNFYGYFQTFFGDPAPSRAS